MRTISIMRRCWAPALAVTLLASAGCKQESKDAEREGVPSSERVLDQTQERTEQAYEEAQEAQETAQEKTEEAISAREEVMDTREELTEEQKELQRQQQEAQEAQQRAQLEAQQAQQQAQTAQERAQEAQEESAQTMPPPAPPDPTAEPTTEPPMAGTTAEGTVQTASQDQVVIRDEAGSMLELDVDPGSTTVLKDGLPATISDLEEGSKVKVSYRSEAGQQIATRIEAGAPADEG